MTPACALAGACRAIAAELERRQQDEASVCPEDVGVVEYIHDLRRRVEAFEALVRELANHDGDGLPCQVDPSIVRLHMAELGRQVVELDNKTRGWK